MREKISEPRTILLHCLYLTVLQCSSSVLTLLVKQAPLPSERSASLKLFLYRHLHHFPLLPMWQAVQIAPRKKHSSRRYYIGHV